jgi:hypothetical protein
MLPCGNHCHEAAGWLLHTSPTPTVILPELRTRLKSALARFGSSRL